MKILIWHIHGSWTTSFVSGSHQYLLPVVPDRGPRGRGRAQTWDWPPSAIEITPEQLNEQEIDLVILQDPSQLELAQLWTGRVPGHGLPAIYLEHNTPKQRPVTQRHPLADQSGIPIVHVTAFNRLVWDNGRAQTYVIDHGIPDPGQRWTGEIPRAAVAINEPIRRGRVTGSDLLKAFDQTMPLDLFGMKVQGSAQTLGLDRTNEIEDPPQSVFHDELAQRAVYLHTARWTSLGLSLIEAMHLGMPIVAVGSTEAYRAIPPEAGCISTDIDELVSAARHFLADHQAAAEAGAHARKAAIASFGLNRFLQRWDEVMKGVVS